MTIYHRFRLTLLDPSTEPEPELPPMEWPPRLDTELIVRRCLAVFLFVLGLFACVFGTRFELAIAILLSVSVALLVAAVLLWAEQLPPEPLGRVRPGRRPR